VTSSPTDAAASMATPRTCPSLSAGLYVDRIEHILDGNVVGPVFLDDDPRPSKIVASRRGRGSHGESLIAPQVRQTRVSS